MLRTVLLKAAVQKGPEELDQVFESGGSEVEKGAEDSASEKLLFNRAARSWTRCLDVEGRVVEAGQWSGEYYLRVDSGGHCNALACLQLQMQCRGTHWWAVVVGYEEKREKGREDREIAQHRQCQGVQYVLAQRNHDASLRTREASAAPTYLMFVKTTR